MVRNLDASTSLQTTVTENMATTSHPEQAVGGDNDESKDSKAAAKKPKDKKEKMAKVRVLQCNVAVAEVWQVVFGIQLPLFCGPRGSFLSLSSTPKQLTFYLGFSHTQNSTKPPAFSTQFSGRLPKRIAVHSHPAQATILANVTLLIPPAQATIPAQPANYAPLLANARVFEVGPKRTKILCVTHVQGRLSLLCNLIQNVGASCVINAGNFGFFGAWDDVTMTSFVIYG
jgi:hypothetical protein